MKRIGMILGIGLMLSGTSAWAQTDAATAARQRADEAKAKAQALLQAEDVKRLEKLQLQGVPGGTTELNNALGTLRTKIQTNVSPFGEYSYQVFTTPNTSTSDPLKALQVAPGTWWNNGDTATRLNLTKDQQKKMDDIFQQFRLKLIDLNAALSKEELIMDPLIASEKLDESKILTQIDRIAQARAELEKANSRMLLGIRQSLTMEQWTKVQASPATFRVNRPAR